MNTETKSGISVFCDKKKITFKQLNFKLYFIK